MALIREIIDHLTRSPVREFGVENPAEAFRSPSVVDGDCLRYSPGVFNGSVAKFSVTVDGCAFVRVKDDPLWRPKDEDDLIGSWSFAHSVRFRDLGYELRDPEDKGACREQVLKVLSDLLNKDGKFEARFARSYRDFPFWVYDFENLKDALHQFHHYAYAYVDGHWRGVPQSWNNRDMVTEDVCALGLLESLDAKGARDHVYVDVARDKHELLAKVVEVDENVKREFWSSKRPTESKTRIRMLTSKKEIDSIRSLLLTNDFEERLAVNALLDVLEKTVKRWKRDCEREILDRKYSLLF